MVVRTSVKVLKMKVLNPEIRINPEVSHLCQMLQNVPMYCTTPYVFVCIEVLRPSQPNRVMLSVVSLPNHTFTGQV